jgi:hypothetical protein
MKMMIGMMLPQVAETKEEPSNRLTITPRTDTPEAISPRYQAQERNPKAPNAKISCKSGPISRMIPVRTPIVPNIPPNRALPVKAKIGQQRPNKPPIKARIAIKVTPNGRFIA